MNKFSGSKIFYHPEHVIAARDGRLSYPVHVNIDTTNYCNHRCLWCSAYEEQKENHHDIDSVRLLKSLGTAVENGLKAVTHIGFGEPTLHREFLPMTRQIHNLGIEQGMFTHGAFPLEYCDDIVRHFTWVRFSFDAGSAEIHATVHGTKNAFDTIVNNMTALLEKRKGPDYFTVGVQFALHQANASDLLKAAKLSKSLGLDYFSIKPVIKRGAVEIRCEKYKLEWEAVERDINEVIALSDKNFEVLYKPYQFQVNNTPYGSLENKEFVRHYTRCYAPNFEWWIRNNLDVDICGPMRKTVGNLLTDDYADILGSEAYMAVLNGINIENCYRGCRPHYLNETMHALEHPDFRIHKNFVG